MPSARRCEQWLSRWQRGKLAWLLPEDGSAKSYAHYVRSYRTLMRVCRHRVTAFSSEQPSETEWRTFAARHPDPLRWDTATEPKFYAEVEPSTALPSGPCALCHDTWRRGRLAGVTAAGPPVPPFAILGAFRITSTVLYGFTALAGMPQLGALGVQFVVYRKAYPGPALLK